MGEARLTVGTGAMDLLGLSRQFPNALKSHLLGDGCCLHVGPLTLGVRATRYSDVRSGGVSHTQQFSK